MKNTLQKTEAFQRWFDRLRDNTVRARILSRITEAEEGYFGDCRSVGGGVSEMRIHCGPGYRIYYGRRGEITYLLIAGGDKSSQSRDIAYAKAEWKKIKEEEQW